MRMIPLFLIPFFGLLSAQSNAQAYTLEPAPKTGHLRQVIKKQLVLKCTQVRSLINLS
jgi:hypothetical protein